MHFVTGGAFNGKRVWVKEHYPADITWISAYESNRFPDPQAYRTDKVVLEGMEEWVKKVIDPEASIDILLDNITRQLEDWLIWEKAEANRELVIIGTDISKGIVPMEKIDRMQRDLVGWVYQWLVRHAAQVDVIWYGISETIKNKKERL